ncbi:MAG TPA: hypothetical protein VI320_26725 [Terracidiphilus sp.]
MTDKAATPLPSLIPTEPLHGRAEEFTERVHGLLDGQPKDEATVAQALEGLEEMFDLIAAGMYSIASMLVGEGEDSIRLVETAVANADLGSGQEPAAARKNSRLALCAAALDMLSARNAQALAAPQGLEHAVTCIEDDDLDAAGDSTDEFEQLMSGPDRDRVRNWLESLPADMRTIFVLRAVAALSTSETANLLRVRGGPQASGWTSDSVRELFRQGLCSLASHVLQAAHH